MVIPWPCNACGADGVRNIGARGYCARHLGELYGQFDSPVFDVVGVGLPGRTMDDTDLTCVRCGATWQGHVGESCAYCANQYAAQLEWQARLLLRPPEVDRDDATWLTRMGAWIERLKRGVADGLITDAQARHAITKEQSPHDVAA